MAPLEIDDLRQQILDADGHLLIQGVRAAERRRSHF